MKLKWESMKGEFPCTLITCSPLDDLLYDVVVDAQMTAILL